MPFIKVYIHFVWSTKNRYPFLVTSELQKAMWQHIRDNGKKKGIFIDFVNGYKEHCHCLVSLGDDQSIQQIMKLIKGESSYWINKENLLTEKFEWQDEYFAVSVSESHIDRVRNYIKNQADHHSRKTWEDEYSNLIEKYQFQKFND
jgi:REP element-mobilizing transposase RayT